jgi:hypothetical protein
MAYAARTLEDDDSDGRIIRRCHLLDGFAQPVN